MRRQVVMCSAAIAFAAALSIPTRSWASQPAELPDYPNVRTLAGSGLLGVDDGPAARASFVSPAGIAYDKNGNLIIADRDAQRIRILSSAGVVTTLAGSAAMVQLGVGAPGGYRDGVASHALFNMPQAVLALPSGTVLVADTKNYCIRSIVNGIVSTLAGDHNEPGSADGPRSEARFTRPTSFASDGAGNVYVADPPNGIRKIDAAGNVSTLALPNRGIFTLVASVPGDRNAILASTANVIVRIDLRTNTFDGNFPLESSYLYVANREGMRAAGPASSLAAFQSNEFVFTDPLNSAVRFGQTMPTQPNGIDNYTRPLTQTPAEDASLGGIGVLQDGPGDLARVDEPMGIAVAPDGGVVVADTGNRRIRRLSPFNHVTHVSAAVEHSELPAVPNSHEYRIAVVGNSYVWWNQAWHESIAGMAQDELARVMPAGIVPRVLPIMREGIRSTDALQLIESELNTGVVNAVVLDLTSYGQMGGDYGAQPLFPANWETDLTAALKRTKADLDAAHVPFFVLLHPGASDFPNEMAYYRVSRGEGGAASALQTDPANIQNYHDRTAAAVAASGVATIDVWPSFLSLYGAAEHPSLFAAWDHHLSAPGRALVVRGIVDAFMRSRPWSSASR